MYYLRKNTLSILLFLLWLGLGLSLTTAHADENARYSLDIAFVSHFDASLPEQDVFIERKPNSGDVYRVTSSDNDMDAPLFKTRTPVPHNPYDAFAIGPYPKGESFGITLGKWLQHRGSGTYTCANGVGHLNARFTGMIEHGVYTMWHAFTARPATAPFSGYLDVPLGARDGSTSVFVADQNGAASFRRTFKPCLQMSDAWTTSLLAVNYHSDGRTYAGLPGEFGLNAHMPLFLVLPSREAVQ